jgi:hypothetical protein
MFYFFVDEVRKFFGNPMGTDEDGYSIKSRRGEFQMNGGDVFKDGGDDKANWYHWESTACWSPLKIMLTGNDTASSWSVEWDVDDRADRSILFEASIIEISRSVLTKLFL